MRDASLGSHGHLCWVAAPPAASKIHGRGVVRSGAVTDGPVMERQSAHQDDVDEQREPADDQDRPEDGTGDDGRQGAATERDPASTGCRPPRKPSAPARPWQAILASDGSWIAGVEALEREASSITSPATTRPLASEPTHHRCEPRPADATRRTDTRTKPARTVRASRSSTRGAYSTQSGGVHRRDASAASIAASSGLGPRNADRNAESSMTHGRSHGRACRAARGGAARTARPASIGREMRRAGGRPPPSDSAHWRRRRRDRQVPDAAVGLLAHAQRHQSGRGVGQVAEGAAGQIRKPTRLLPATTAEQQLPDRRVHLAGTEVVGRSADSHADAPGGVRREELLGHPLPEQTLGVGGPLRAVLAQGPSAGPYM